jgi:hypothetical protein
MSSPEALGPDETVEKECCGASTASALGLLRTSTIAAILCHRWQLAACAPRRRGGWATNPVEVYAPDLKLAQLEFAATAGEAVSGG